MTKTITVAYGDGIGPEIMDAVLRILRAANTTLAIETIEIGNKAYEKGSKSGIPITAWQSIHRTKVLLKAPLTTPRGEGYQSVNVRLRKMLSLCVNIRPYDFQLCGRKARVTVIRENEEGLYCGVEYRHTPNSYSALKLVSERAAERICNYAFAYAHNNQYKRVTCMVKDNILKLSDGIFYKVFKQVAARYSSIESNSYLIDIGSALLSTRPEMFEVIVTTNLYGDIISDILAQVSGSVGLAGSINIGKEYAMFEAVHGTALNIANQNIANPSGLLQAAIYMLSYLKHHETAKLIHNALFKTLQEGIHTPDLYNATYSTRKVCTDEFTEAVINNLYKEYPKTPEFLPQIHHYQQRDKFPEREKVLVGVDIYVAWPLSLLTELIAMIKRISQANKQYKLYAVLAKGIAVWRYDGKEITTLCEQCDNLCCRFINDQLSHHEITLLLQKLLQENIEVTQMIKLYFFDNEQGFFSC